MLGQSRTSLRGTAYKPLPGVAMGYYVLRFSIEVGGFSHYFYLTTIPLKARLLCFFLVFNALVLIVETDFELGFTATKVTFVVVIRR